MATFLFDDVVFGPVSSRRLGTSLGINLLPSTRKVCNFNCVYCECGETGSLVGALRDLPRRGELRERLETVLRGFREEGRSIDVITFAGNGEPTLHPEFSAIAADVAELRDTYAPGVKIALLSNATRVAEPAIRPGLRFVDRLILKLDAGREETFSAINRPLGKESLSEIVGLLKEFSGDVIIQTLFLRFRQGTELVDNTDPQEVAPWLAHLVAIRPHLVMLYSLARDTPLPGLETVPRDELETLAVRVRALGFDAEVF